MYYYNKKIYLKNTFCKKKIVFIDKNIVFWLKNINKKLFFF